MMTVLLAAGLIACRDDATDGAVGAAGLSWRDTNQNGVADMPAEQINGDGVIDVNDCVVPLPPLSKAETPQKACFTDNAYEGTGDCLLCHGKIADHFMTTGHPNREGVALNVGEYEAEIHGKADCINNFCIAVPGNTRSLYRVPCRL